MKLTDHVLSSLRGAALTDAEAKEIANLAYSRVREPGEPITIQRAAFSTSDPGVGEHVAAIMTTIVQNALLKTGFDPSTVFVESEVTTHRTTSLVCLAMKAQPTS